MRPTGGSPPSPLQSRSPVIDSSHRPFHAVELLCRSCSIRLQRLHNGLFIEWRPGVSTFLIAPGQSTLETTFCPSRGPSGFWAGSPRILIKAAVPDIGQSVTSPAFVIRRPGAAALLEAFVQISPAGILIDLDEHRSEGATPD